MTMEVGLPASNREFSQLLDMRHSCGGIDVVECRVYSRESFGPKNLFLVQRAVWFSELGMSLGRKFAEAVITGQVRSL